MPTPQQVLGTYLSRYNVLSLLSMSTHGYNLVTINAKSKGTILSLFIKTGNHTNTICDLSMSLPLGVILLAININQKLATIDPKYMGTILNLFGRSGNHTNMIRDLSTPLTLGAILLDIDINRKLVTKGLRPFLMNLSQVKGRFNHES